MQNSSLVIPGVRTLGTHICLSTSSVRGRDGFSLMQGFTGDTYRKLCANGRHSPFRCPKLPSAILDSLGCPKHLHKAGIYEETLPGLNLSFDIVSHSYIVQITSNVTIQGINQLLQTQAEDGLTTGS